MTDLGRLSLLILVAVVLLAGCGSGDDETGSATTTSRAAMTTTTRAAPTGPIDAGIRQYREDEAAGVLQIQLHNVSQEAMRVTTLRLSWDGLEPSPDATPDYPLAPGVIVDLPTPLGRAVCRAEESDPAAATAVVGVTHADGSPGTLTAPVTDGFDVLDRVHTRLCNQQSVTDNYDIAFSDEFTPDPDAAPPVATGTLTITRRPGGEGDDDEVVVERIVDAGVLLNMTADSPVLTLAAGATTASGVVTVKSSGRCDAHALADSKTTYKFTAVMTIAGEERRIDLQVPESARLTLHDVIDRTCS